MHAKKVLVTGGTGFVGANLVRRLLRDGHQVHLLVRPERQEWRIADIRRNLELHEAEVSDRPLVSKHVEAIRPDWVFHLAAHGAYSWQTDAERIMATNIAGCMALADACLKSGVEAFVHSGSSSEYGLQKRPSKEDDRLEPNSPYAITKAAATHYCQYLARSGKLNAITLRLYSIYGPYEESNRLVPTLLTRGLEGRLPPLVSPDTARDFVYVDDAVDAMVMTASNSNLPAGSVFNVCSGRQTTIAEIVAEVRDILDISEEPAWASMPGRSWDTNVWLGDPSAMYRATGWKSQTSLRDGLEQMARWLRVQTAVPH